MRRFSFLLLPALACGGHVESAIVPESTVGRAICENRVLYTEDVEPPVRDRAHAHATTLGRFELDSGNRLVRYRETANATGVLLAAIDRTYDGSGRALRRDFVGSPWRTTFRWTWDDANGALQTDDDELIDGRVVRTTAGERWDDAGRILFAWAAVDRRSDVTYAWPDANTVLATTERDGLIERVTLVGGRFVARDEHLYRGRVDSVETTTYDAELHPTRREYTSPSGDSTTDLVWEGGRLRVVTVHATSSLDRRVELAYDEAGNLIEKRRMGPDLGSPYRADTTTSFRWQNGRVVRAERRKNSDGALIQTWEIERGCADDGTTDAGITPVGDWKAELEVVPFRYDFIALWGPPTM